MDATNVAAVTTTALANAAGVTVPDSNSCYDAADVDFAAEVILINCVAGFVNELFP